MAKIQPPKTAKGKIKLDWKAYFDRFIDEHGEPVVSDGVLLFQDGWRYSLTDYKGPEYKPPKERKALTKLKRIYWTKIREQYDAEAKVLKNQVQGYEELALRLSLPLQQTLSIPEPGKTGHTVYRKGKPTDLDLTVLHHQLDDLESLIEQCDTELGALR